MGFSEFFQNPRGEKGGLPNFESKVSDPGGKYEKRFFVFWIFHLRLDERGVLVAPLSFKGKRKFYYVSSFGSFSKGKSDSIW